MDDIVGSYGIPSYRARADSILRDPIRWTEVYETGSSSHRPRNGRLTARIIDLFLFHPLYVTPLRAEIGLVHMLYIP